MSKNRYFPVVISAPSGGGKSAIKDYLLKLDARFAFSVTCTTRKPRPGEKEGRDYYFVSSEKFEDLRKNGSFIEWAEIHGNYYGTPKDSVFSLLDEGKIPLMTIDVRGAKNVKLIFKDAVSIFILPPSIDVMISRLRKRGESEKEISVRLNTARVELREALNYDYLVINDKIEKAAEEIMGIVKAEALGMSRNSSFVDNFAISLENFK